MRDAELPPQYKRDTPTRQRKKKTKQKKLFFFFFCRTVFSLILKRCTGNVHIRTHTIKRRPQPTNINPIRITLSWQPFLRCTARFCPDNLSGTTTTTAVTHIILNTHDSSRNIMRLVAAEYRSSFCYCR